MIKVTFKTSMIRSNLCNYSDAYLLCKWTITIPNTAASGAAVNNTNKKVIFKNCAPFTNCITEINNTQVDGAQDIDIVMPMYNLMEYTLRCLMNGGGTLINFSIFFWPPSQSLLGPPPITPPPITPHPPPPFINFQGMMKYKFFFL